MTLWQQAITILMCVLGTMLTRFLPFLVFSSRRPTPKYIQYLGQVLSEKCLSAAIQLRSARTDRDRGHDRAASVETPDALVDRRRNRVLYAARAVGVCVKGGR